MIAFVGPETLGIALIIAVVVFGASRLPQIARSVGQAKGEFEKGLKEGDAAPKDDPTKEPEAKRASDGQGNGSAP